MQVRRSCAGLTPDGKVLLIPLATPRPTIDAPGSPAPQLDNPMARVGMEIGAGLQQLAAAWQSGSGVDVEKSFQDFKFNEMRTYDKTAATVTPATSQGFADNYDKAYKVRSDEWMKANAPGLSRSQSQRYEAEMGSLRLRLFGSSSEFEEKQQFAFGMGKFDAYVKDNATPRAAGVAVLPDDAFKVNALQELQADAVRFIDSLPLSEKSRDDLKNGHAGANGGWVPGLLERIEKNFADSLPPFEKSRLDPKTPDPTVVDRIIAVEGVRRNPKSSAVGPGQFIADTWVDLIKRYKPELNHLSRQEILDLRTGPLAATLGTEMVRAYSKENGAILDYNRLAVTPGNLYLAHFLGPQGAVDMLSGSPAASAADLNPAAAKANPNVFYALGDDGRPDKNQPRTVAEIQRWAGALMSGTYHTDWGRQLTRLSHDYKVAAALDGSRALMNERTALANQADAAYKAQLSAWKNAAMDGKLGYAELATLYDDGNGPLNDPEDRAAIATIIEKRTRDGLALTQAQTLYQDKSVYIGGHDPDQRKAMNLVWDELAGKGVDVYKTEGDDLQRVVTFAERTNMIPEKVVSEIQGGIYSSDPGRMRRGFELLDSLSKANPAATAADFKAGDLKRLDLYQSMIGRVPEDVMLKELQVGDPQTAKLHDELKKKGAELASQRPLRWAGAIPADDPRVILDMQQDYATNFSIAYSYVRDEDEADRLAKQWMAREKWAVTDAGSGGQRLMAYPPERYYPSANGNWQWIDDQLAATVQAVNPRATEWGVEAAASASRDVSEKASPAYHVWYKDELGGFHYIADPAEPLKPQSFTFNPSTAAAAGPPRGISPSEPLPPSGLAGIVAPPASISTRPLDPTEYLRLFDLTASDPDAAISELRAAFAEQRIDKGTFSTLYTHAKNVQAGGELPPYFKSISTFVSSSLRPPAGAAPDELENYMDAQFVWDDWVSKHGSATREEAQSFGNDLVRNHDRYVSTYKRDTLPMPKYIGVPNRFLINEQAVADARKRVGDMVKAGTIGEGEARNEAALLQKWGDIFKKVPASEMPAR